MKKLGAIVLLAIVQALAGCNGSGSGAPLAATPVPQAAPTPPPISLIVFTDFATGLSTSDVRDAQEQIVHFTTAGELIWTADGTRFPGYGANRGNVGEGLEVRFGTKDGERRAYLIFSLEYFHYAPPAIVVDLEVVNGQLVVTDAKAPVPLPGS